MKRWPIIRHIRWLWHRWMVDRHYAMWRAFGYSDVHRRLDEEMLDKIRRGEC